MTRSLDDILDGITPREDSISLCLRGDLVSRYEKLERQLANASTVSESLGEPSEAYVIASQMKDLHEEMAAAGTEFMLRAMPSDEWSDLHLRKPIMPTRGLDGKANAAAEKAFRKDFVAWWWEAVAGTCYDPEMTPEGAGRLAKKLSNPQWGELTERVWTLNTGDELIPFSEAASAILQATEPK